MKTLFTQGSLITALQFTQKHTNYVITVNGQHVTKPQNLVTGTKSSFSQRGRTQTSSLGARKLLNQKWHFLCSVKFDVKIIRRTFARLEQDGHVCIYPPLASGVLKYQIKTGLEKKVVRDVRRTVWNKWQELFQYSFCTYHYT